MRNLIARSPKQLDICLRLLYAEHVIFSVNVQESNKRKIEYMISADVNEDKMAELEEKYRILIS